MSGGANIVEQYSGADVPARIELLIKYYPNFIRLVEGYEQNLIVTDLTATGAVRYGHRQRLFCATD